MNKMLIAVLKINLLRHLLLFSALIYFRSLLRCLARYQLLLEKLPWIKDRGYIDRVIIFANPNPNS